MLAALGEGDRGLKLAEAGCIEQIAETSGGRSAEALLSFAPLRRLLK